MRLLTFGLLLLALTTTGCTKSTSSSAAVSQNTQTSVAQAPITQAPANDRPRIEIVRDAIFSVNSENDNQALSYSNGWKKVLADADAKASAFSSDEMKAEARSEFISAAHRSVDEIRYEEEGRTDIKRLKLAYLQQHPDAAFVLGYFKDWRAGLLVLGCCPDTRRGEPYPPLPAHNVGDPFSAKVTPEEMDKALTLIMEDHNSEYQRDEELSYQHAVAEVGSYDRAASAKDAKDYLYKTYIALAVVGDFRSELVDNQEPTPEGLSKHVRKAFLIDDSNGSILIELKEPWGRTNSSAALLLKGEEEGEGEAHDDGATESSVSEQSVRKALDNWVQSFRSKDARMQAECYAPIVETYFRWHNIPREQLLHDKEKAFAAMGEIRKYDISDVQIAMQPATESPDSSVFYSRADVTFQKDWDTSTVRGKTFAGKEIEKLTLASSTEGWKIVGEQELKILSLVRQ